MLNYYVFSRKNMLPPITSVFDEVECIFNIKLPAFVSVAIKDSFEIVTIADDNLGQIETLSIPFPAYVYMTNFEIMVAIAIEAIKKNATRKKPDKENIATHPYPLINDRIKSEQLTHAYFMYFLTKAKFEVLLKYARNNRDSYEIFPHHLFEKHEYYGASFDCLYKQGLPRSTENEDYAISRAKALATNDLAKYCAETGIHKRILESSNYHLGSEPIAKTTVLKIDLTQAEWIALDKSLNSFAAKYKVPAVREITLKSDPFFLKIYDGSNLSLEENLLWMLTQPEWLQRLEIFKQQMAYKNESNGHQPSVERDTVLVLKEFSKEHLLVSYYCRSRLVDELHELNESIQKLSSKINIRDLASLILQTMNHLKSRPEPDEIINHFLKNTEHYRFLKLSAGEINRNNLIKVLDTGSSEEFERQILRLVEEPSLLKRFIGQYYLHMKEYIVDQKNWLQANTPKIVLMDSMLEGVH